jgi:hypothetical protein
LIGAGALLDLDNGAAVSTTGALANDGTLQIDANNSGGGSTGGSSLTLAGGLTKLATLPRDDEALGIGRGDGDVAR